MWFQLKKLCIIPFYESYAEKYNSERNTEVNSD